MGRYSKKDLDLGGKIYLTGGTGYLGRKVRAKLQDYRLYWRTPSRGAGRITWASHLECIRDRLGNVEYVINCAAATDVDKCEIGQDEEHLNIKVTSPYSVNAVGPLCLTTCFNKAKFIHISTDYVFDGNAAQGGYLETSATNPIQGYGFGKLIGELNTIYNCRLNKQKWLILRTSSLYGYNPGQNKNNLVTYILNAKPEDKLFMHDQITNPTLIDDVASVIKKSIGITKFSLWNQIYHCVGPEAMTRYDFASKVCGVFEIERNLIPVSLKDVLNNPGVAPRPQDCTMNTKKLTDQYGLVMHGVEEGLKIMKYQMECDGVWSNDRQ